MPSPRRAALANWMLRHLPFDTWLNEDALARRLQGLPDAPGSAAELLNLAAAYGWLEADPICPDWYCLPTVCWLPQKRCCYAS